MNTLENALLERIEKLESKLKSRNHKKKLIECRISSALVSLVSEEKITFEMCATLFQKIMNQVEQRNEPSSENEPIIVPAEEGQIHQTLTLPNKESYLKIAEDKLINLIEDFEINDEKKTYIIKDDISGYYKIGRSKNPKNRLKQVCPTYSTPLLVYVINDDYESMLHKQFNHKRVKGEWFNLDSYDLEWIYKRCE